MKNSLNRRHFIKATSLATGAVVLGVPALVRARNLNSKLNLAAIGVTGKGQVDTDCCAGENIVALCDVDAGICNRRRQKYPGAKFYQDFRRMFDQMGGDIDAVTVSTPALEPVTVWWYDGGYPLPDKPGWHDGKNKPPRELMTEIVAVCGEIPRFGYLLIGDKGKIFSDDVFGGEFFVKMNDEAKFIHYKKYEALAAVPQSIVRNPFKGSLDYQHHLEWLTAIKAGKPEMCYSRFDIGAKLSEIPLLGCLALRAGKKIEWDGPNMRVVNCPEAASFVKRDNRAGWPLA